MKDVVSTGRDTQRERLRHMILLSFFFLPSLPLPLPSHPSVDELLMKGVTVVVYTGQLDLIVDTMGRPLCNVNKRSRCMVFYLSNWIESHTCFNLFVWFYSNDIMWTGLGTIPHLMLPTHCVYTNILRAAVDLCYLGLHLWSWMCIHRLQYVCMYVPVQSPWLSTLCECIFGVVWKTTAKVETLATHNESAGHMVGPVHVLCIFLPKYGATRKWDVYSTGHNLASVTFP